MQALLTLVDGNNFYVNRYIVTWGHFNFLSEYDFPDEKLQDSVGIQPPKIQPNLR